MFVLTNVTKHQHANQQILKHNDDQTMLAQAFCVAFSCPRGRRSMASAPAGSLGDSDAKKLDSTRSEDVMVDGVAPEDMTVKC